MQSARLLKRTFSRRFAAPLGGPCRRIIEEIEKIYIMMYTA